MRTVDALRAQHHRARAPNLLVLLILFLCVGFTQSTSEELVVGPAEEINGQTLQGALSQFSGQWSLQHSTSVSRYFSPYGVAVSKDGNTVYVGEAYKHRVRAVDVQSGSVTTIAGGTRGLQDGPAASSKFSWPYGVALSPDGETLYVADSGNDCIRAVSVSTGIVSTLAGSGSRGFADGAADEARFSWPYGVGVSPSGDVVYVADSGNNRVRTVNVDTGEVATLAGNGPAGFADGPASKARFYGPRAVVVSPDGTKLYVADYSNFRVRAVDMAGKDHMVSTILNGGGDAGGGGGGGSSNQFYRPAGVAVTPDGSIVIAADSANSRIRSVRVAESSPLPLPPVEQLQLGPTLDSEGSYSGASENATSSDDFLGNAGVLDPFRDVFFGDIELNEARQRRVITAVILFLILGILALMAIVAVALWQRRNALLMLRLYQNSNAPRYSELTSPVPFNTNSNQSDAGSSPEYGSLPAHAPYIQAPHPYIRRSSNAQPKGGILDSPPPSEINRAHSCGNDRIGALFRRNLSTANLSTDTSSTSRRQASNGSSTELDMLGGPMAWQEV